MYGLEQLRGLPKIELHVHLEAAMTADMACALYNAQQGVCLSVKEWRALQHIDSVQSFLQAWRRIQDSITCVEDYFRVAQSACVAQADDGIIYCEMYFSASAVHEKGLVLADVVSAIEAAVASEPRLQVKLLADLTRDYGERHALHVLEQLQEIETPCLVGVGLGGSEHQFPARLFRRLFEQAQYYGFQSTVHAGEMAGADQIATAVHQLHAQRIGHALHVAEREQLYESLVERSITVEACPGSNLALGLIAQRADYPLRPLMAAGVSVCINSDDPLLCGARLSEELYATAQAFQLHKSEIQLLQRNALDAAFVDHHQRAQLRHQLGWLEYP